MMVKELHGRWYLSAFLYRFTYSRLDHQLDDELFSYLGERISDGIVLDCGCGPGVVAEKFLSAGARRVVALDINPLMLYQTRIRLGEETRVGSVVTVQAAFEPGLFSQLFEQNTRSTGFDVILFKRSLYMKSQKAASILKAAAANLAQDGILVVVHPDHSLQNYVFGGMNGRDFMPFHLVNRTMSVLGQKIGLGTYTLYSRGELLQLISDAVSPMRTEFVPSQQWAYNMVAVHKNEGR